MVARTGDRFGAKAKWRACVVCGKRFQGAKPVGDTRIWRGGEVIAKTVKYGGKLGYAHLACAGGYQL